MNSQFSRRTFIRTLSAATLAAGAMSPAFGQAERKMTLAFVGVAHIHTPGFISLLKTRSDVKVKFVWDHDAARAEKSAKELDAQVATDPQQIWSDPQIAAVVICSETNRHHDLVLAGAKAGKHMFV